MTGHNDPVSQIYLKGATWPNVTGKDGQWNAEQRCCTGLSCADSGFTTLNTTRFWSCNQTWFPLSSL